MVTHGGGKVEMLSGLESAASSRGGVCVARQRSLCSRYTHCMHMALCSVNAYIWNVANGHLFWQGFKTHSKSTLTHWIFCV